MDGSMLLTDGFSHHTTVCLFTSGLKMWFWVSASVISGIWSIILGLFLASSYMSNTAALDPGFYYVAAQQAAQALKKAQ
jgi:hypothetical protein